jgi:hypothetical protein
MDVVIRWSVGDVLRVGRGSGGKNKKNTSDCDLKRSLPAQLFILHGNG